MAANGLHRYALLLLLACGAAHAGDQPAQAASTAAPAAAPGRVQGDLKLVPVKPVFAPASAEAMAAVKIHVEPGRMMAGVGPGVLVAVDGWAPGGRITAMLAGSKGESVYVIPFEQPVQVGPDGVATFLVPYRLKGITPGAWKLVIDGASGEHSVDVQILAVDSPDAQPRDAGANEPAAPAASATQDASPTPGSTQPAH